MDLPEIYGQSKLFWVCEATLRYAEKKDNNTLNPEYIPRGI